MHCVYKQTCIHVCKHTYIYFICMNICTHTYNYVQIYNETCVTCKSIDRFP